MIFTIIFIKFQHYFICLLIHSFKYNEHFDINIFDINELDVELTITPK